MQNVNAISILIAEDHPLFSEGLKTFLENTGLFSAIYQAFDGAQAVEAASAKKPDIILMDIHMPEMNGLQAAAHIKALHPDCKIIMLTSFTDPESVKRALSAGVEGYCSKEIDPKRLLNVIDMVHLGSICLDPAVADFVLRNYFTEADLAPPPMPPQEDNVRPMLPNQTATEANNPPIKSFIPHTEKHQPAADHVLKGRELEVLALVANGRTHDEIADTLQISIDWVNAYIKSILLKLAVDSEWDAVKKAIADGALRKVKATA